jgi:hypothetical protein
VEAYDTQNKSLRTTVTGTLQWYEHMVMPSYCHFGGMVSSFKQDRVNFWYSEKYPECSTMCQEKTKCDDTSKCRTAASFQLYFLTKIWNVGKLFILNVYFHALQ